MSEKIPRLISLGVRRAFFSWSRTLHIYISTALFTLLIFFCVSGITLNHASWFTESSPQSIKQTDLPAEVLAALTVADDDEEWPRNIDVLYEFIQTELGLKNARSLTADRELGEIELDYPLPASYAYVLVDVNAGQLSMESEQGNVWAVLNDLHKGRHTGEFWSWVIDISAGLMLLFALTGLFILFQLRKRRRVGVISVIIGTLTPFVFYLLFVPSL